MQMQKHLGVLKVVLKISFKGRWIYKEGDESNLKGSIKFSLM